METDKLLLIESSSQDALELLRLARSQDLQALFSYPAQRLGVKSIKLSVQFWDTLYDLALDAPESSYPMEINEYRELMANRIRFGDVFRCLG